MFQIFPKYKRIFEKDEEFFKKKKSFQTKFPNTFKTKLWQTIDQYHNQDRSRYNMIIHDIWS